MDEQQILKELHDADWVTIQRDLLVYTLQKVRFLRWRGFRGADGEEGELVKGVSCKDLVQTLIRKTLSRDRKWDPDRGPLMPWLKLNMRSEISALVNSDEHLHEQDENDEDNTPSATSSSDNIDSSHNPVDVVLHQAKQEEDKKRLAPFFEAAAEFPELAEIVEAVMNGCELKPRYLAEELGTTTADINNRLKRLRRLALRDTKIVGFPNA